MKQASWIVVVALALAAGCFSGKSGPRGTNLPPDADKKPGTTQDGVPALVERP
jgi:hypothetical protein